MIATKTNENQIIQHMPSDEYFALKAVNRTLLEVLHNGTPAHVQEYLANPPEVTPAMEFGQAVHLACLEPELFEKCVVAVSSRSAKAREQNPNKILILEREKYLIDGIKNSLSKTLVQFNPEDKPITAQEFINQCMIETTLLWRDPVTNLLCKARLDMMKNDAVIDFKTTTSIKEFARSAYNFGYHRQAAFYTQGLSAAAKTFASDCYFLVVEKEAPFAVKLFKASPEFIASGTSDIRDALDLLADCYETNEWPCYSSEPEELLLPPWARR